MAGIGFGLRKYFKSDTYFHFMKAGFYSAFIMTGPWIVSTVILFGLTWFAPSNIDSFELTFFRSALTFIYAFSFIGIGFLQLSLTRYLADKLYTKDESALLPAFNTAVLAALLIQAPVGLLFFGFMEVSFNLKLYAFLLYLVMNLIWLVMIFLTTLRDYASVAISFLAGLALGFGASIFLGRTFGLEGFFLGYLVGHLAILILLSSRIFIEFGSSKIFDRHLFRYLWANKTLVGIGICYNTALWIDKIAFWYSPSAVTVTSLLKTMPIYESAAFFAYLTMIPAFTIFLILVETSFYERYRDFYAEVLNHGSYSAIQERREQIAASLRRGIRVVAQTQGMFSLLAIAFAPEIIGFFKIGWVAVPLFRVIVAGVFLQSILWMCIIIILYFDFQKLALTVSLIFLALNGVLSALTGRMDVAYYGYGYLASVFVSLVVAYYALDRKLGRLTYWTFAPQPIGAVQETGTPTE